MEEARVTFCGQGEANSGTTAAASRQHGHGSVLAASVPPSTTWKRQADGSFQVCCMLKWRGKSARISEFCLSILGCWKQASVCDGHGSAGRRGAACLLLAKPPIWELRFYLGIAHERKTHCWVLQDVFCPRIGGGLRHSSPADHPPPPHSQRLFARWCLRDTPAWPGTKSNLEARKT